MSNQQTNASLNPTLVKLTDVFKTFNAGTVNEVRPMQGVNLTITEGSFVIVLGGNGSGKSTLLNAIAGSFPIDNGTIELDGQDVTQWPEHKRAILIGRVFQNPRDCAYRKIGRHDAHRSFKSITSCRHGFIARRGCGDFSRSCKKISVQWKMWLR